MRAVVQRVKEASVKTKEEKVARIDKGLLVLLGIHKDDTEEKIDKMAEKISKLRVFEDSENKMNFSVKEVKGSVLVVSQFTLYGDCKKGNRPSFVDSAKPEKAKIYYEKVVTLLEENGLRVETGVFGAMMDVSLINDGPVTLIIDL